MDVRASYDSAAGGLWTAAPRIAMGWYTFFTLRREIKKAKGAHGGR